MDNVATTSCEQQDDAARRRTSSYQQMLDLQDTQYKAALNKEKQDWLELFSQRSKACRLIRKEVERGTTLKYKEVKPLLSAEHRELLAARPDYVGLLKSARDAKNAVDIAAEEKRECYLRAYHVVEKIQEQVKQDAKVIIDLPDPILD